MLCNKCHDKLEDNAIKFYGVYWCNYHIPNKYFDPEYEHLIEKKDNK